MDEYPGTISEQKCKTSTSSFRPVEPDDPDEETEESLAKARAWDDWKDTHKRGEGNRYNRS